MEYASVVWNHFYIIHVNLIKSIQKKFLVYALRRLGWSNDLLLPSYASRCMLLDLDSLLNRRNNAAIMLIYDLITNHIDAPNLLELIEFHVPRRMLRNTYFLEHRLHRTNYSLNEPIANSSRLFNNVSELFDFCLSRNQFHCIIRQRIQ